MVDLAHVERAALTETVRGWFRLPYEGMGYRAELNELGTFWDTGMVYPSVGPERVAELSAAARDYYERRPVFVVLDTLDLEAELGEALLRQGCSLGKADVFLAHVGEPPDAKPFASLTVEMAGEGNLSQIAAVKLEAFAASEGGVVGDLATELERRRNELAETGCGMLARIDGRPAGMIWWYEEEYDRWVNLLATLPDYAGQGVGGELLRRALVDGYQQGRRSIMINVLEDNARAMGLYRCLGFTDPVYRRQRYVISE